MARIYVSSTFRDLREHRARVNEAIRKLGHEDVAMEHYVAEHLRPIERCVADVRSSDVYVGVFANRYGYVPPGSECSITESEFREAQRSERRVLCFLLDDDRADTADWPAEAAGADRLTALKEAIREQYLVAGFVTPDELATEVAVAVTRTLDWGRTPLDLAREHRLMREWRHHENRGGRVRAGSALANMGSPRYAAALKDLLLEVDEHDVEAIAHHLHELLRVAANSDEVMPVVAELLGSADRERRFFATYHIGELGLRGRPPPSVVLGELLRLQADPERTVRKELAHTLSKLSVPPAEVARVRAVLEALSADPDADVAAEAVRTLDALRW